MQVRRSDQAAYRALTQTARAATGARLVFLARLDPDGAHGRTVALEGTGTVAFRRAVAAAQFVRPGFRPINTVFRTDVNEHVRLAYQEGRAHGGPVEEAWRGILDGPIVRLATTLARLRYSFTCPLVVAGRLWGGLGFVTTEPLDGTRRQTCLAIAGEAERILGDTGHADGLRLQHMTVILRPVAEVFGFVSDFRRRPEWQAGLLEVHVEPPGPARVGTRVADVRQVLGQRVQLSYEVTQYEPNQRYCVRSLPGSMRFEACITFAAFASGTLVTVSGIARTGGFFRVAEPIIDRMVHRQFEADFGTLGDLLHARVD